MLSIVSGPCLWHCIFVVRLWSHCQVIVHNHLLHGRCDDPRFSSPESRIVIIVVVSTVVSTFLPSINVLVIILGERLTPLDQGSQGFAPLDRCTFFSTSEIISFSSIYFFTTPLANNHSSSCVVEFHVGLRHIPIVVVMILLILRTSSGPSISYCICLELLSIVTEFIIVIGCHQFVVLITWISTVQPSWDWTTEIRRFFTVDVTSGVIIFLSCIHGNVVFCTLQYHLLRRFRWFSSSLIIIILWASSEVSSPSLVTSASCLMTSVIAVVQQYQYHRYAASAFVTHLSVTVF
jgi:hypothetical protein